MKKRALRLLTAFLVLLLMTGCDSAVENTEPTKKVNFIGVNSAATGTSPVTKETVPVQNEPINQTDNTSEITEPQIPDDLPEYYVDDLLYDMANNALRAEVTYQDQYMLLTGRISGFDSDGAYFSLDGVYDNYDVYSMNYCSFLLEAQETYSWLGTKTRAFIDFGEHFLKHSWISRTPIQTPIFCGWRPITAQRRKS